MLGVARRGRGRPSRLIAAAVVVLATALVATVRACTDVRASDLRGRVVRVRDGDTIEVRSGRRNIRVRVFGVDCPERGQPWASRAKQLTSGLVGSREVVVKVKDRDAYGRIVGEVVLEDGRRLGAELVRAGLAWHYRRYSDDATLAALEAEARAARRGLWSDPHPKPPWRYRQEQRGGSR